MENKNSLLSIVGVILLLIGFFLPWHCYSGFVMGCDQRIYFDSSTGIFLHPESYAISLIVIVLLALGLNAAGFNLKQTLSVFVSIFYGGALLVLLPAYVQKGAYFLNDEFLMLVLSTLTTWLVFFSLFNVTSAADRFVIASSLILALVSAISIGQTLYEQFIYNNSETLISLQFGLPLILLGSLIVIRAYPPVKPGKNQREIIGLETEMDPSPDQLD